jgi:hypothetical protein
VEAFPEKVKVPLAEPLLRGLKCTENGRLCPAARVIGSDSPVTVNSRLLVVAEEMTAGAPLAVSIAFRVFVLPTATLPKFRRAGWRDKLAGAVPVPETAIARELTS